jgi:hypothetical protein
MAVVKRATSEPGEGQKVLQAHRERTNPANIRVAAEPGGDFAAITKRVTQPAEAALATGFSPAAMRQPGGCVQLIPKAWIGLAMGQHIGLMAGSAEGRHDVADVDRPVTCAGLKGFFWNNNVQD